MKAPSEEVAWYPPPAPLPLYRALGAVVTGIMLGVILGAGIIIVLLRVLGVV